MSYRTNLCNDIEFTKAKLFSYVQYELAELHKKYETSKKKQNNIFKISFILLSSDDQILNSILARY